MLAILGIEQLEQEVYMSDTKQSKLSEVICKDLKSLRPVLLRKVLFKKHTQHTTHHTHILSLSSQKLVIVPKVFWVNRHYCWVFPNVFFHFGV
jgi:hypothetical protein